MLRDAYLLMVRAQHYPAGERVSKEEQHHTDKEPEERRSGVINRQDQHLQRDSETSNHSGESQRRIIWASDHEEKSS